jgi:hypothetical protein
MGGDRMKQEKLELKVGNVYEAYLHYEDDDANRSFFAMLLMAIVRKGGKSYFVCYKQTLIDLADELEIDRQYIHIFDEYGEEIEYDYAIGFYLTDRRPVEDFEIEDGKHRKVWDIRLIKPEFRVINNKKRKKRRTKAIRTIC